MRRRNGLYFSAPHNSCFNPAASMAVMEEKTMGNKKVVLTISITVLLLAIAVMGVFYITENRKSKPVSVLNVVSSQL